MLLRKQGPSAERRSFPGVRCDGCELNPVHCGDWGCRYRADRRGNLSVEYHQDFLVVVVVGLFGAAATIVMDGDKAPDLP